VKKQYGYSAVKHLKQLTCFEIVGQWDLLQIEVRCRLGQAAFKSIVDLAISRERALKLDAVKT